MISGLDRLISEPLLHQGLKGKRVGLLAHPASVTSELEHAVDALSRVDSVKLTCGFGPQHGMKGEVQDNMIETEDYIDPTYQIPIYSLYGKVRRPTNEMLEQFDVLLVDLQDVGCRIYTFLTTLFYLLEDCEKSEKEIWVLDRPNPAGREVEGQLLGEGWESFVGGAPVPIRHGLTLGEAARWYADFKKLSVSLKVIEMKHYDPSRKGEWGWPKDRAWVNPSPNAASLNMVRCFAGTVLLEGTTLSEGRGTTRPLELVGAPHLDFQAVLNEMQALAPEWCSGAKLRLCSFQPMFQKYQGEFCQGFQIHAEGSHYLPHVFKPFRLVALCLKSIRRLYPEEKLWREFEYEYEKDRLAIDLISGGDELRKWVEDESSSCSDYDTKLAKDESLWRKQRAPFLIYPE